MSSVGRKRGADADIRNSDGNNKIPRQETYTLETSVPPAGQVHVAASPPGSLKRIYLENFMCHNKLEVNLGRHVNFIVGENGAGKSAILTALFVCFGTNACQTNRARNLKEFIKHGANYALVSVTLCNEGEDAFKPEVYGPSITIERRILASSNAQITVKNSNGGKVAQGKGELEMILDHLSIDVNNPCTVMDQDQTRNFLHSGRDEDKYTFFMQATQLGKVREALFSAKQDIKSMMEILSKMELELPEKKNQWQAMEDMLLEAQQVDCLREQQRKIVCKIAWHDVYCHQCRVQDLEDILSEDPPPPGLCDERKKAWGEGPTDLAKTAIKIATNRDALQRAKAAEEDATKHMDSLNESMTVMVARKQELLHAKREARRDVYKAEIDERKAATEIRDIEIQKRKLESLMQESMQKADTDAQVLTAAQQEAKRQAQVQLESAQSELRAVEEQLEAAKQQVRLEQEAVRAEEGREAIAKQKVERLRESKAQLHTQSTSTVAAFGHNVQTLLKALAENERIFDRMPVGPIGRELSLADAQWSTAVEACIGRHLNSFIVKSYKDKDTLTKLAKQVGSTLAIIVFPNFDEPRYNIPQNRLPREGLVTMLRTLNCSNDLVTNVLIDHGHVERVVLCSDNEEAFMVGCRKVPPYVKEVYTKDGTRYHKKGCSEVILPYRTRYAPRLGVDIRERQKIVSQELKVAEDALKSVQESKQMAVNRRSAANTVQTDLRAKMHRAAQLIQEMETKLEELQSEHAVSQADAPTLDMSSLEAQLAKLDKSMKSAQDCQASATAAHLKANSRLEQVVEQLRNHEVAVQKAEQDSGCHTMNMQQLKARQSDARAELEENESILERIKEKITAWRHDLEQARQKVEEKRARALQVCTEEELAAAGGMDTRKDAIVQLNKEFERITKQISRQESRLDGVTIGDLEQKYRRAKTAYEKRVNQIAWAKEPARKLESGLNRRNEALNHCIRLTGQAVSHRFNAYMSKRGHAGRVKILHDESKLELVVDPARSTGGGRDCRVKNTKTLSGGERSYSTLAFTLALGASNEAPFRAMDEFDVYMDAVNRRVGTEHLIAFARQHAHLQFIYLTPQDVSMLDKELVNNDGFIQVQKLQSATR